MNNYKTYQYDPGYISEMCQKNTHLNEEEIESVLEVAKVLPYMSEIFDTEAFIDIISDYEEVALVVAECLRHNSVFTHSYLGEEIYKEDEPAIFQSYYLGRRISGAVAVSHDKLNGNKILTHQTCVPILCKSKAVAVISEGRGLVCETQEPKNKQWSAEKKEAVADLLLRVFSFSEGGESAEGLTDGLLIFNREGELEYYNSIAEEIYKQLGYLNMETQHFDNLNFAPQRLQDYMVLAELKKDALSGRLHKCGEAEICIDGRYYSTYLIIEENPTGKILLRIRDNTKNHLSTRNTKDYLVTYQEIHHRIKNNLQTVASLLRLQMNSPADTDPREGLAQSVNRILSIASIYELLSKKSGDEAQLQDILRRICINTADCHQDNRSKIHFFVKGDDVTLDSDRLVVVSLVATELIQNAMKHAFKGRDSGEVVVNVSNVGGICQVEIRDDGIGFPKERANEGSLGMAIVNAYVSEKLEGMLDISSGVEGTKASFAFSLQK